MSALSATESNGEHRVYQTYGEARFTAGFPACRLSATANSEQTTYANSLLSAGHGYPLFQPVCTYDDDPDQTEIGLRLGDVGYFNEVGHFVSLFNIFQTKRTERRYLPKQYAEMKPPLSEWEIHYIQNHFPPGTIVASEGITVTPLTSSPLKIKISTKGVRGAVVALPQGASRQDIANVDALRPHIEQNALDWYQYANSYDRNPNYMRVRNGGLYLITGLDLAPRWTTGIITDTTTTEFEYHGSDNGWHPPRAFGKREISPEGKVRGNIFIRGLTIALGSAIWARYMPRLPPSSASIFALFTPCGDADFSIFGRWKLKVRAWLSRRRNEWYRLPDTQPTHPALIFVQAILGQAPSANVIMVHDSTWSSTQGISLRYPDIFDRIVEILDKHVVKVIDGVAILTPKDEASQSQLTSATRLTRLVQIVFGKPRDEDARRLRRVELWRMVNHTDPI